MPFKALCLPPALVAFTVDLAWRGGRGVFCCLVHPSFHMLFPPWGGEEGKSSSYLIDGRELACLLSGGHYIGASLLILGLEWRSGNPNKPPRPVDGSSAASELCKPGVHLSGTTPSWCSGATCSRVYPFGPVPRWCQYLYSAASWQGL